MKELSEIEKYLSDEIADIRLGDVRTSEIQPTSHLLKELGSGSQTVGI